MRDASNEAWPHGAATHAAPETAQVLLTNATSPPHVLTQEFSAELRPVALRDSRFQGPSEWGREEWGLGGSPQACPSLGPRSSQLGEHRFHRHHMESGQAVCGRVGRARPGRLGSSNFGSASRDAGGTDIAVLLAQHNRRRGRKHTHTHTPRPLRANACCPPRACTTTWLVALSRSSPDMSQMSGVTSGSPAHDERTTQAVAQ